MAVEGLCPCLLEHGGPRLLPAVVRFVVPAVACRSHPLEGVEVCVVVKMSVRRKMPTSKRFLQLKRDSAMDDQDFAKYNQDEEFVGEEDDVKREMTVDEGTQNESIVVKDLNMNAFRDQLANALFQRLFWVLNKWLIFLEHGERVVSDFRSRLTTETVEAPSPDEIILQQEEEYYLTTNGQM
ncbi:hypothetical protein EJB05_01348 [Eragrostis curvula]|uniref:Uncharacterized protein n=1 Tax=Eragrostis curvula TaxID=38414 RepID=A0A5J9WPD0_9POAL|nr:hypothetical protein EJB05_01348 [Eragrostis curvula]